MPTVYLICEGPSFGLDNRVLDSIIAQRLGVPVLIAAAGGETGLDSVASWIEERSRRLGKDGTLGLPRDVAVSVRDRNYRRDSEAKAYWEADGCKRLIWRRHEIENYLLEPRLVLSAFASFRRTVPPSPWLNQLPQTDDRTTSLLAALAKPMLEDHAGRLVHWQLREAIGRAGSADLARPAPKSASPGQYACRDAWVQALIGEVERLKRDCATLGSLPDLLPESIEATYYSVLERISHPSFTSSGQFLRDLKGKELLTALCLHLTSLGARRLRKEDLEQELVAALAREYRPDDLYQPDEFRMLERKLRALAEAPKR